MLKSFTLKLPGGASIAIGVDALAGRADSGLLAEDLTDLLVAAGEAAGACDSGLMVAVDEVQYLSGDELAGLVTAIHRTTQLGLPVLLTGAGLPRLPALVGAARSYAERLFEFPAVNSLPPEEAAAVVAVPAGELGVELTSAAVNRVVTESSGYPYFLQEWGYHVWNAAPASPITEDDINAARSSVIHTLDRDFFRVRFDRLTPKEKDYLRAMAVLGPGRHRSGDIAAALGVKVESVAPRRSGLIAKGMIYSPAHGDTAFTVPLFDSVSPESHAGPVTSAGRQHHHVLVEPLPADLQARVAADLLPGQGHVERIEGGAGRQGAQGELAPAAAPRGRPPAATGQPRGRESSPRGA